MLSADSRGRAAAHSRPAKLRWLPASVPAGVCSCLHDDLEPTLFSGAWHSECSWRRMQRSRTTDALPSAGCSAPPRHRLKLVRQRTRWWEPPSRLVSAAMPNSVTTCLSRARWLLTPAYFFKYTLLSVCDWLPLSLSRSWTWINHEDTRLLCSYNKAVTSPYHTHTLTLHTDL